MTAKRDITSDCVAIAFYGITSDTHSLTSLYNDLVEWFNSVECPPDKLSVHGPGFGGKPVGFARAHSRLCKQRFSEITSLSVFAMLPSGQLPTVDWWAIASLDLANNPWFVLAARSSVTTLEDDRLARLITSCVSRLNPVYGIGY